MDEEARLKRLVLHCDGLHYSFEIAEAAWSRAVEALDIVSEKLERGEERETEMTNAIMSAWTLVDAIHRAWSLVQETPGFSGEPAARIFVQRTAVFEELRHHIQHLRGQIASYTPPFNPIWGGISWVPTKTPNLCRTAVTGTWMEGAQSPTISFDTQEKRWTSKLTLFAGGARADLEDGISRMRKLRVALREWIGLQPRIKGVEKHETLIFTFHAPQ